MLYWLSPRTVPTTSPFIIHALSLAAEFKYPLIFIGAAVEGPMLTVASGFLLHGGVFNFSLVYLMLVFGDLAGDVAWYYIGYFFALPALRKHGKFFGLTPEVFEKIRSIFHRRSPAILFVSKITMGFGMALGTLMTAGATRIPLRTFLFYNMLGEFIYVGALMLVGYYFGYLYASVAASFRFISLVGLLLTTGLAIYGFTRYIKSKTLAQ